MTTTIIRIGNSKGVLLSSRILKKLNLSEKAPVNVELRGKEIVITPSDVLEEDLFSAISKGGWYTDSRDAYEIAADLEDGRGNERTIDAL